MTAKQLKELFNAEIPQEEYDTYLKIKLLFEMRDLDDWLSHQDKSLNDFDADTIKAMVEDYEDYVEYPYASTDWFDEIISKYTEE